jgi:hypothetical protein
MADANTITGKIFVSTGFSFGSMGSCAEDGTVTLDWDQIERAADGQDAMARAIARILLAARDAGRPAGFV